MIMYVYDSDVLRVLSRVCMIMCVCACMIVVGCAYCHVCVHV